MKVVLPELSLVFLIGPSGAGKSTFAARHFGRFETVSSDFCRGLVCNNETDQSISAHSFDLLHTIVVKRLELGHLTVVDATNVQKESRRSLLALARRYHVLPIAIVFDVPERVCVERYQARPDRNFGSHVVRGHLSQMRRSLGELKREGFRRVFVWDGQEEVTVAREPVWNDLRGETGPFDVIGDVHGCAGELDELIARLGDDPARKRIYLGDLVDRGPRSPDVLRRVMSEVEGRTLYEYGPGGGPSVGAFASDGVSQQHLESYRRAFQGLAQRHPKNLSWLSEGNVDVNGELVVMGGLISHGNVTLRGDSQGYAGPLEVASVREQ